MGNNPTKGTVGYYVKIIRQNMQLSRKEMGAMVGVKEWKIGSCERNQYDSNPNGRWKYILLLAQQAYLTWLGVRFWDVFNDYKGERPIKRKNNGHII